MKRQKNPLAMGTTGLETFDATLMEVEVWARAAGEVGAALAGTAIPRREADSTTTARGRRERMRVAFLLMWV